MSGKVFHLYGRRAYQEPLAFIATLEAADAEVVKEKGPAAAGEGDWVELVAIPDEAVIRVIPEEE